jgi:hypothetical protein
MASAAVHAAPLGAPSRCGWGCCQAWGAVSHADPGNPDPDLFPPDIGTPRRDPDLLPPRYPSPGGRCSDHTPVTANHAAPLPAATGVRLPFPPARAADMYPPPDRPDMPEPPLPGRGPFMAV